MGQEKYDKIQTLNCTGLGTVLHCLTQYYVLKNQSMEIYRKYVHKKNQIVIII